MRRRGMRLVACASFAILMIAACRGAVVTDLDDGGVDASSPHESGVTDDGPDDARADTTTGPIDDAAADAADDADASSIDARDAGPEWSEAFGALRSNGLVKDHAGNLLAVGESMQGSIFVAKADRTGAILWTRTFAGNARATSVAVDSQDRVVVGGAVVAAAIPFDGGSLEPGPFVMMFSSQGDLVWIRTLCNGGSDVALAVTPSDDILAAGAYSGLIDTTCGDAGSRALDAGYDSFAVKLDSAGNLQWLVPLTAINGEQGWSAAPDLDGGAVLGTALGGSGPGIVMHVDGNGSVVDTYSAPLSLFESLFDPPSGDTFALGVRYQAGGWQQLLVTRLTPQMTEVWTRTLPGPTTGDSIGSSIALDSLGNVVVGGVADQPGVDFGAGPSSDPGIFAMSYAVDGGYLGGRLIPTGAAHVALVRIALAPPPDTYFFLTRIDDLDLGQGTIDEGEGGLTTILAREQTDL